MDIIVSYDIIRNHTDIKNELKELGYKTSIPGVRLSDNSSTIQQLPNTTLIKYGANSTKACCDQVASVIQKHGGGLQCLFCAELAQNFSWNGQ